MILEKILEFGYLCINPELLGKKIKLNNVTYFLTPHLGIENITGKPK